GRKFRVSSNVYIPSKWADQNQQGASNNILNAALSYPRPQVLGQFFVGVVFWPAIIQHNYASSQSTAGTEAWMAKAREKAPEVAHQAPSWPPPQDADAVVTLLYKEAERLSAEAGKRRAEGEKLRAEGEKRRAEDKDKEAERLLAEANEK